MGHVCYACQLRAALVIVSPLALALTLDSPALLSRYHCYLASLHRGVRLYSRLPSEAGYDVSDLVVDSSIDLRCGVVSHGKMRDDVSGGSINVEGCKDWRDP